MPILLGELDETNAKSPWRLLDKLFKVYHLVLVVVRPVHDGAELFIIQEIETQVDKGGFDFGPIHCDNRAWANGSEKRWGLGVG